MRNWEEVEESDGGDDYSMTRVSSQNELWPSEIEANKNRDVYRNNHADATGAIPEQYASTSARSDG